MNRTPSYLSIAQSKDDEINLVRYLDVVVAHRWLIFCVVVVVLALGAAYAFVSRPVYQADILIQVEDSPNNAKSLLGDVSNLFDVKADAAAEIEILQSRMVVGKAVENLQLYIEAQPKYFPLIGRFLASKNKRLSEPGLSGFGGYVWGGEAIHVATFEVPVELEGETFTLVALADGGFRVEQKDLDKPIEGRVGEALKVTQSVGVIQLEVTELKAKPGAAFTLVRKSKFKTLQELRRQLSIAERGKQSGVIGASLEGKNPVLTARILNEIGDEYVAQNVRRKAAEAEKSLLFLTDLLPQLKNELERSEASYNAMRNKRGTFDLSEEGKAYLQESVAVETRLQELKQRRTELEHRFTPSHPVLVVIGQQIAALSAKVGGVTDRIKALPNVEQDTLRLMRDVKVNNELYVSLLNNMQQLRLVKAGKVGNVRLVDSAPVPEEPVKPGKLKVLAAAAFLGVVLGVVAAFVRNALRGGITDSKVIEQHTGLNVYANVVLSSAQEALIDERDSRRRDSGKRENHLLARRHPNDPAIEGLRSLRTALQFATLDADNNRVLISGPTQGVGKSFVSANLAAVIASGGKRVLLVDADTRKGHLNRHFGKAREPGLSDVLTGSAELEQAIHREVAEGLDLIATGTIPPNPAELLLSKRVGQLMDTLSSCYDLVLIDTPPVLAVTDTAILAAQCGTVLLVARFGKTTIDEIAEAENELRHAKVAIKGVIFNGLDPKAFRYSYGARYRRYRYVSYGTAETAGRHK
ncbi:polysaccharide biosynthesis tyrosine autokinase [Cupriavidus oxalaticus]|uniref:Putative tyrosine-protein kinase EpsB n=1 Tax=Cupriavidus oxalaticus TaxID=96344 RepID=A0A4P7LH97_9BURK|nr:polysaccharide biosynthesis tyrosine autokinase [Cupriavidus oxalaticus]QBY55510.1 polysaccharide biosynthesis tyrosine autokinase [Cupriavidus oxalaticus]